MMQMQIQTKAAVPAGMIETAAGRILHDGGYARLLAAFDEAYEATDHVSIRLGDETPWAFVLGDHLERDGTLHIGDSRHGVVQADSTVLVTGGTIRWTGTFSSPMAEGVQRAELFDLGGRELTVSWIDGSHGPYGEGDGPQGDARTQMRHDIDLVLESMRKAILEDKWRETELLSERLRGLLLDIAASGSTSDAEHAAKRTMAHRSAMTQHLGTDDPKAVAILAMLRYDSGLAAIVRNRISG